MSNQWVMMICAVVTDLATNNHSGLFYTMTFSLTSIHQYIKRIFVGRGWFMTSMSAWPIEWYNSVLGLSQNVFHQGMAARPITVNWVSDDYTQVLDLHIKPRSSDLLLSHLNLTLPMNTNLGVEWRAHLILKLSLKSNSCHTWIILVSGAQFFFFIFGGTIIDQSSLLVGHLSIQTLLKTLTNLEHLT